MGNEDLEIGAASLSGQRLPLDGDPAFIIDSRSPFETLVLIKRQDAPGDIVTAGEVYQIDRHQMSNLLKFSLETMDRQAKYVVAVYSSGSPLDDILVTLGDPRVHLPLKSNGALGAQLFEIYNHKEQWRIKMDGSPFNEGLPSILSAYTS